MILRMFLVGTRSSWTPRQVEAERWDHLVTVA